MNAPRRVRRASAPALLALLVFVLLLACEDEPTVVAPPPSAPVRVTNLANGETLEQRLAIVDGVAGGTNVVVTRMGGGAQPYDHTFPVVGGRFRALVTLNDGRNELRIRASDGGRGDLIVNLAKPDERGRYVQPLYVIASDDDGMFQAEGGEQRDVESARKRIQTAMLLLQAFTAEAMHEKGFGRRTFQVGDFNYGVVNEHKTSLTMAEAHAMSGDALWQHIARERTAATGKDAERIIDVAVLSMTRYDGATRKVVAHAAHGGERLALFGSGTLHTFAPDVDQVVDALTDDRVLDPQTFFDDSGGRGTHWAAYATGMGAMLHELGHCFGLAHAKEGVMARAFDHVNRSLVLSEPGPAPASAGAAPLPSVGFDRSAAVRLRFHPFITPPRINAPKGGLKMRMEGAHVAVESPTVVRHIEVRTGADALFFEEHAPPSNGLARLVLLNPRARAAIGNAPMQAIAIDDDGNSATIDIP